MKLTEAQARLAGEMAAGAQLIRGAVTRSFYLSRPETGLMNVSSRMVERMREAGLISATGRRDAHNGNIYELTAAGRAALSAKEAENG